MDLKRISRYLSLLLRHKPEVAGLTLDPNGWVAVEALIEGVRRRHPGFDLAALETIVATDDKQRYAFSDDRTRIRASQGHSVRVDVQPTRTPPPQVLWHGTGAKYVSSILQRGLLPQGRLYVHLSADPPTAMAVGRRHGSPVLLRVESGRMAADGFVFYRAANGVWLTDLVPVEYLEIVERA